MSDAVHVVPHDHLAGWQGRRIRREGLRAVDGDDIDGHEAGTAWCRSARVPAVSAAVAGPTAAPHDEAQRDYSAGRYECTHDISPFVVVTVRFHICRPGLLRKYSGARFDAPGMNRSPKESGN